MIESISRIKSVFIGMIALALLIAFPIDQVLAAIAPAEGNRTESTSEYLRGLILGELARDEVRSQLLQQGIDPAEAEARFNALTDQEADQIATGKLNNPGAASIGIWIGAFAIVIAIYAIVYAIAYGIVRTVEKVVELKREADVSKRREKTSSPNDEGLLTPAASEPTQAR